MRIPSGADGTREAFSGVTPASPLPGARSAPPRVNKYISASDLFGVRSASLLGRPTGRAAQQRRPERILLPFVLPLAEGRYSLNLRFQALASRFDRIRYSSSPDTPSQPVRSWPGRAAVSDWDGSFGASTRTIRESIMQDSIWPIVDAQSDAASAVQSSCSLSDAAERSSRLINKWPPSDAAAQEPNTRTAITLGLLNPPKCVQSSTWR